MEDDGITEMSREDEHSEMNNSDHRPRKKRTSFILPNINVKPFDKEMTTAVEPMSARTFGAELRKPGTLIMNEPNTQRNLLTDIRGNESGSQSPIGSSDGNHSPDEFPAPRKFNQGLPAIEVRSQSDTHLLKRDPHKNINIVINVNQDKET